MTPAEFADAVVIPTVREHLVARGDRRLAYLACIVTYSLVDYIAWAEGSDRKAREAVGTEIKARCAMAYEVVQGICNGTKHVRNRDSFKFTPGDEVIVDLHRSSAVAEFPLGMPLVASRFALGHSPMVVEHGGKLWSIDHCVTMLLHCFATSYPCHFAHVDWSSINMQVQL